MTCSCSSTKDREKAISKLRRGGWVAALGMALALPLGVWAQGCARGEDATSAAPPLTVTGDALVYAGGLGGMPLEPVSIGSQAGDEVAAAETLKRQAIGALKTGDFDKTQQLINEALQMRPDDRTLLRMDEWVSHFQERRAEFNAERRKAFERQVRDVELLQEHGFRSYAITAAARARMLSDDRHVFNQEGWVRSLIGESVRLGMQYEEKGQWLRAMRVWGELAMIEEQNPEWKKRQRQAYRRVRLLAVYVPEILDELRDETQAERDEVDALLRADRAEEGDDPEVADAGDAEEADEDKGLAEDLDASFRTDWREDVAGITMTMLRDAIEEAQRFYVRDVELRDMLVGGLEAVEAIVTTPGLERTFPTLDDEISRERFLTTLREQRQRLATAQPRSVNRQTTTELFKTLAAVNRQTVNIQEEVLVSEFADGALTSLDPFSGMIWPSQIAEFTKGTHGEFVGVGIQIRGEDNGDLRVVSPLPDTPAYEAGIVPDDVITHIDGKNARGINDQQAVRVITGRPGTSVTLTIRSIDGTTRDVTLVRRQINTVSVKGWRQLPGGSWEWLIDPDEKVGYLRLTNFQRSTSQELSAAIEQLKQQGARGIILDLRNNPGGLLQAAVEVADRFLPDALIVSTRGERPTVIQPSVHTSRQRPTDVSLPIVVLVNEYSASASEIVSGALRDHSRAMVVGQRTFGKGSVQMLFRIGRDEALLKLTTSYYYLPSGRNLHKEELDTEWGVDPDVPVEMTPEQMRNAIFARQALDALREDGSSATVTLDEDEGPVDAEKALLDTDAQLSAALLLMRMHLAGERLM